MENTKGHYVCRGRCEGVSEVAKKCGDNTCDRFDQDLEPCDCTDSKHFDRQGEGLESEPEKTSE